MFNRKFYAKRESYLMEKVEANMGKPYCDVIKRFYDGGNGTGVQCIIPYNINDSGCFRDNLEIEKEMELYTDMFVEEMSKQFKKNVRLILCCVQCNAPDKDDIVRLIGRVEFGDLVDTKTEVDYVLFYEVDSGTEAINSLYPDGVGPAGGRSGKLSTLAKERVVKRVEAFLSKVHKKGIEVDEIVCGRGLLWLPVDEETKRRFEKQPGSGALIPVVPGKGYLVRDTMAAFLQTKMESIPFDQQLEVYRHMCSPNHDSPLSKYQKKRISDIFLGIEELQSNNDDNSNNDFIDEEESLTELLSDDDNDDDANIDADADADAESDWYDDDVSDDDVSDADAEFRLWFRQLLSDDDDDDDANIDGDADVDNNNDNNIYSDNDIAFIRSLLLFRQLLSDDDNDDDDNIDADDIARIRSLLFQIWMGSQI